MRYNVVYSRCLYADEAHGTRLMRGACLVQTESNRYGEFESIMFRNKGAARRDARRMNQGVKTRRAEWQRRRG